MSIYFVFFTFIKEGGGVKLTTSVLQKQASSLLPTLNIQKYLFIYYLDPVELWSKFNWSKPMNKLEIVLWRILLSVCKIWHYDHIMLEHQVPYNHQS